MRLLLGASARFEKNNKFATASSINMNVAVWGKSVKSLNEMTVL
jgi:hypothetical protein